jgi:hypothetical protein
MGDWAARVVLATLFTAVIAVLVGVCAVMESWQCHSKWGSSGLPVRYGVVSGCQVKAELGWIPAESYRTIN